MSSQKWTNFVPPPKPKGTKFSLTSKPFTLVKNWPIGQTSCHFHLGTEVFPHSFYSIPEFQFPTTLMEQNVKSEGDTFLFPHTSYETLTREQSFL